MPCAVPVEKLIGTTIDNGRLRLLQPLGRGSGGVVFRAVDTTTRTQYAVKCVLKAPKGSRQYNFQVREIKFHHSVSGQRNVVTLHRVVQEDPYIFLVMDLCEGGDLFKFLTEKGTFRRNNAAVKHVFLQLIDAVDSCHRRGIYHRDIKPENVMCNEDGTEIRLGDFGLSTDTKWSRNFGAGTSAYMSPECIGAVGGVNTYSSPSNDVWALGVILTSMISGHNPWRQAVMSDDCFRTYVHNPGFFRQMLPISEAADDILRRIFTNHDNRLSLRKLRRMIVAVDTFFMTDEEIAGAGVYVQMAAASYLCDDHPSTHDGTSVSGSDEKAAAPEQVDEKSGIEDVVLSPASPHSHDPRPDFEAHSPLSTLVSSDVSEMVNTAGSTDSVKRSVPPPQPMPSYQELMRSEGGDLEEASTARTKSRRMCGSESPVGLLRRWIERIFV